MTVRMKLRLWLMPFVILAGFIGVSIADRVERGSDEHIRNRVVMLQGNDVSCSGIEIKAPSGQTYILTAAHCRRILDENEMTTAITEDGVRHPTHLVTINIADELMLLTSVDSKSIDIAKQVSMYEHIHTLTHGDRRPTYRTDGTVLDLVDTIQVRLSVYDEFDEYMMCFDSPKKIETELDGLGLCTIQIKSLITTAKVIPGSSGGAVLNEKGELVGIVSNTDGFFSGIVPLDDIHTFLKHR